MRHEAGHTDEDAAHPTEAPYRGTKCSPNRLPTLTLLPQGPSKNKYNFSPMYTQKHWPFLTLLLAVFQTYSLLCPPSFSPAILK